MMVFGDELILAGSFTAACNIEFNHIARWNGIQLSAIGTGIPENVSTLAEYGGQLFAGGYQWDGVSWHQYLTTDDYISAMTVYDGKLIVAGDFSTAGGEAHAGIVAWDGQSLSPLGLGIDGTIRALAVHDGLLYAGGQFTQAGGVAANNLATWNGLSWSPVGGGIGGVQEWCCDPNEWEPLRWQPIVYSLGSYQNDLIIGGTFCTAGADTIYNIARWNGETWSAIGEGFTGYVCETYVCRAPIVLSLSVYDGNLVAGGAFNCGGSDIAYWDGSQWSAFGNSIDLASITNYWPTVTDIAEYGGKLYAAGDYFSQSLDARDLAVWDNVSWSRFPTPYGLGLDGDVYDQIIYDGNLVVCGWFTRAGEIPAVSIAALVDGEWETIGTSGLPWDMTGYPAGARSLALFEGDLIAGGNFSVADGTPAQNVARWNGFTWQPMGEGLPADRVETLYVHQGQLYAGTSYDFGNGTAYRWNGSGWDTIILFNGGWSPDVMDMTSYDDMLVIAGGFENSNGQPIGKVVAWDGETCHPLGEGISGYMVRSLAVQGDRLIAGGGFYTAGGDSIRYIAAWDGTEWSSLGDGLGGGGSDYGVHDMAVAGDQIFVCGRFTSADGLPAMNLAEWTGNRWREVGGGIDGSGYSIGLYGTELIIGGDFNISGQVVSNNLAVWRDIALPVDHDPVIVGPPPAYHGGLRLSTGYPNPFNPRTTLRFSLPEPGRVRILVYDVRGREVAALLDADMHKGDHEIDWDGTDSQGRSLPSGVYRVRLSQGVRSRTASLTLVR